MGKGKAIGIDLGTTHSCVAVWRPDRNDRIEIIFNNQGKGTTPSMVAFTPSKVLVGDAAKDQLSTNPQNTVFDAKRLIGRRFNDPSVQSDMKHWPFTVVAGDKGQPLVQVEYKGEKKLYAAEMISYMVLVEMKRIADSYLGYDVKKAVITVPSYFNNSQRRATEDAAKDAGLNVMRIITEPTAAAIAHRFGIKICSSVTILVFVLGGRSLDVSVFDIQGRNIKVKAIGGDRDLGGEDFDNTLLKHCIKQFNRINKKELNISAKAVRRLRSECEKAKRDLSSALDTVIDIDCLYEGLNFHLNITRTEFEELNADLFRKCMEIVKGCVKGAKLSKGQIDKVVLAGGSTRIPKVQELLQGMFPGEKHCKSIRPEETVAYGAAVYAGTLKYKYKHIEIEDVTPLSKGDDTLLPSAPKKMSTTTAIDNESVRVSVEDDARKKMNATTAIDNVSAMESLTIATPKKLNTRKKMNIATAVNSESVLENAVVFPTDTKAVENHSVVDSAVYEEEPRNKINGIKESRESRTAYQVFINHRGPDVKKNLASSIYCLLKCCGMSVFLDRDEIHTGDTISYAISFAIQSASIHITIFSPRYAESSWCLDELSSILTSRRERRTKIIPVFYDVKPHDLRHIETGRYALTFQEHQQKRRVTIDVIQKWRSALNEVSHISGLEFEPEKDDTGELLERIKGVCSREIDGKL